MWNCRGLATKSHSIHDLFSTSKADLIILNETFRRARTPWPSNLPPCLAEATNEEAILQPRPSNGVAVLANPNSIGHKGLIRSFSILETDNLHGLKVVMKINQFILFALYAPTSAGDAFLRDCLEHVNRLAADGTPVVLCGDLNVVPSLAEVSPDMYTIIRRHNTLTSTLASTFFRADTGASVTRPSNRSDAARPQGNTLDHIFGSNVHTLEGRCLDSFPHTSDHHPIVARLKFTGRVSDNSVKYWRLKTENLRIPEYAELFRNRIVSRLPAVKSLISSRLDSSTSRSSSSGARQRVVDQIELDFVKSVLEIARETLGTKPVPVTPRTAPSPNPSAEYLQIRQELSAVYASLLR